MISANFTFSATNSDAWDLFGRIEFSAESHTLPISQTVIRYAATAAEITFRISGGVSDRDSWFCDQLIGAPIEATITTSQDQENEHTRSRGSKAGLSEKGLDAEDSSSSSRRVKTGAKSEIQYKTTLVSVRAVGTSETPVWHFNPQVGESFLAGNLPPKGTRLMSIEPYSPTSEIHISASAALEYSLISLSGNKAKPNTSIMIQAIWHKHFRAKRRTKMLAHLSTAEE